MKEWGDAPWVALLLLVAGVTHRAWFHFGSILSYADLWFQYPETLKDLFLSNTWIGSSGFGMPNIQTYKMPFWAVQSLLANLGLNFTDIFRITHLIFIAILGFLSPYILVRHLTKERSIAFVAALFYGSTTPFLIRQYSGHLSIAFLEAITPLILYFFLLAMEKNTRRQWSIFILWFWIGSIYELRMLYAVVIILAIYFLFGLAIT